MMLLRALLGGLGLLRRLLPLGSTDVPIDLGPLRHRGGDVLPDLGQRCHAVLPLLLWFELTTGLRQFAGPAPTPLVVVA